MFDGVSDEEFEEKIEKYYEYKLNKMDPTRRSMLAMSEILPKDYVRRPSKKFNTGPH